MSVKKRLKLHTTDLDQCFGPSSEIILTYKYKSKLEYSLTYNKNHMKNGVTVAICDSHQEAEKVVKELQESGFDMKKLSIVGKDYHEEDKVIGFYNTGDRMKSWGSAGAFWGGIWGLVFGAGFFLIPGFGPVMLAGPIVSTLVGCLEGAVVVGGLSALGGALFGIGIPKDSVLKYETALKADNFLVIAHGTSEDLEKAKKIMSDSSANKVDIHSKESVSA